MSSFSALKILRDVEDEVSLLTFISFKRYKRIYSNTILLQRMSIKLGFSSLEWFKATTDLIFQMALSLLYIRLIVSDNVSCDKFSALFSVKWHFQISEFLEDVSCLFDDYKLAYTLNKRIDPCFEIHKEMLTEGILEMSSISKHKILSLFSGHSLTIFKLQFRRFWIAVKVSICDHLTAKAVYSDQCLAKTDYCDNRNIDQYPANTDYSDNHSIQRDESEIRTPTRRKRKLWTTEEVNALLQGYQRYHRSWSDILKDPEFALLLEDRTGGDLKDKMANLEKYSTLVNSK